MLTSIKQRMDREDEGFTLIELMVVLLIIAILLAIAIPTFLGARDTANARSSQENLRNALTAEQSNWTTDQTFATGLSTLEPSIGWTTGAITTEGGNAVSVSLYNEGTTVTAATGNADSVLLQAYSKDGNCYNIFQSNNPSTSFTAYEVNHNAACVVPGSGTGLPTAAPAAGTSASSSYNTWAAGF